MPFPNEYASGLSYFCFEKSSLPLLRQKPKLWSARWREGNKRALEVRNSMDVKISMVCMICPFYFAI